MSKHQPCAVVELGHTDNHIHKDTNYYNSIPDIKNTLTIKRDN